MLSFFFFFNDTATTEIYTLSLHDALPICSHRAGARFCAHLSLHAGDPGDPGWARADRKSTRLNSSHDQISYAVFCLKKKKNTDHAKRISLPLTQLFRSTHPYLFINLSTLI